MCDVVGKLNLYYHLNEIMLHDYFNYRIRKYQCIELKRLYTSSYIKTRNFNFTLYFEISSLSLIWYLYLLFTVIIFRDIWIIK